MSTFLCLRRGVSEAWINDPAAFSFSLPTQRCFSVCHYRDWQLHLFSAYAEVFLVGPYVHFLHISFLCLRRGVSTRLFPPLPLTSFSLPTQRCFSSCRRRFHRPFPFLCLRRGVSLPLKSRTPLRSFSLPTQRCFPLL